MRIAKPLETTSGLLERHKRYITNKTIILQYYT